MDSTFDSLFLLHMSCFGCTFVMALILAFSRLQIRWVNKRYERARWLIFSAMVILCLHFLFQLKYSFYNSGDEVGGAINVLIYVPIAFVIFYSMLSIQCSQDTSLKFLEQGFLVYAIIVVVFGMGCWMYDSLRIGWMLHVMIGIFMAFVVYLCIAPVKEIRRRKKLFESVTGSDILPYSRYISTSYLLMAGSSIMLAVSLTNRGMLLIVGPIVLLCLLFYVISFVSLGFNIIPSDEMVGDYGSASLTREFHESEASKGLLAIFSSDTLSDERVKEIGQRLDVWCKSGGFRDSAIDMMTLSGRINVPRRELTIYFEKYLHRTFRAWLSDVRFNEAQRILKENPDYNNERISSECGFSSHAHLYKIFKARTNMLPKQWKDSYKEAEGL